MLVENTLIPMPFQISDMGSMARWEPPEQRSDGFASPGVKGVSTAQKHHPFENIIVGLQPANCSNSGIWRIPANDTFGRQL